MIRQSLNTAAGRTRPDLARVAEGIAASLRAFSTAQQLAADRPGSGYGDNATYSFDGRRGSDDSQRSGRQRAQEAASDLLNLGGQRSRFQSQPQQRQQPSSSSNPEVIDLRHAAAAGGPKIKYVAVDQGGAAREGGIIRGGGNIIRGGGNIIRGGGNIIRGGGNIIRGGGNISRGGGSTSRGGSNLFRNIISEFRDEDGSNTRPSRPPKNIDDEDNSIIPSGPTASGAKRVPLIIRGGFRGRGGQAVIRAPSRPPLRAGGGGKLARPMGPARPQTGRRQRERKSNDKDAAGEVKDAAEDYSPAIKAMRELKELGDERVFDPTITKKDLVGYGPAVATSESTFAKESTVVRQARILGGAEPYHPTNVPWMKDMKQQYNHGNGVFFPTEEMKKWSAERLGLEAFPPAPQETKDAILQDTLLGMYNGPIFSDYGTPLGSVRNYVAKNSSWNADAARRIEEKVKSLLPRDIRQPKSTQNRRGHARASF